MSESRTEEARAVLQRGLAVDPDNKDIVNALGMVYQALGRHQDAIATHRRYVALAEKEPNAHDSLGLTYQYAGMYREAIDAYSRALALDPDFEIAVVHLGNTYAQLGRYREALQQYRRYIEVAGYDWNRGRGYHSIAWVEWQRGDLAAAWAHTTRAMKVQGGGNFDSVLIALARGDRATAETLASQMRTPASRGARVSRRFELHMRGELALAAGRSAQAIEDFRTALKHPPPTFVPDSFDTCLASALLRLGRFDDAIAEYQRVLRINSNLARARYGLAQALERAGRRPEARAEYQRFVEIWKDADADVPELINAKSRVAALGVPSDAPSAP